MDIESFSLALSAPLRTATGEISRRDGWLVTHASRETVGVGEATPLHGWTESAEACEGALYAVADGHRDPSSLDADATPAASHAVDLARVDLAAREAERPLAAWLDEDPAESVPVNATIGDGEVEDAVQASRDAVAAGFETLKIKVGARSLAADLARVRNVAEAVPAATIRVDANGAWTDADAERAIDELSGTVSLVEQPLPADDLAGHAALRGRGIDIGLDESVREAGVRSILSADAADVIVLKPMVLGGIRRARDLAVTARRTGIDPIVTTTIDGVVARTAALHLAASLDIERACGLATADRLTEDLAPDPAPVVDGCMRVPDAAGIGVRIGSSCGGL
ncbi:MAG: o-succinylbenzoate synthase [Halorhabdus sp.]